MNDQVIISIKLCNRTYRVKAAPENEATVRSTVQEISEKITELKKSFPGRDEQDYMAMVLIDHITSSKDQKTNSTVESDEILKQLAAINTLLD